MTWPQAVHDVGVALVVGVTFIALFFAIAWSQK